MKTSKYVRAFWYSANNFGDNLNYHVIKYLSGKQPVLTHNRNESHFIVCGSILTEANHNSIVWGAGFANEWDKINPDANVIAVRGLLSSAIIKKDIAAFGDPALIMPKIYDPTVEVKHKIGIIPHWTNIEHVVSCYGPEYLIINPLQSVEKVIEQIKSCEKIASSSLHGLILSDAYKVPNKWIDYGSDIGGTGLKFKDYYSTTDYGKKANKKIDDGEYFVSNYKFDLDHFIKTCPFKNE